MNLNSINQLEWESLLEGAINGTLTDSEAQLLNKVLNASPERLDDYIRFVDMHASLYQEPLLAPTDGIDTMVDYQTLEIENEKQRKLNGFWKVLASVTTIAALIAFSFSLWQSMPGDSNWGLSRGQYIGLVTSLKTNDEDSDLYVGRGVQTGLFKLESGKAQVRLDNGVELSMRGPVEFEVFGQDHLALVSGRLTANVPEQAIGFRIDTPDMEIVDLGTEFALKVDSSGESKLHVLEGEVEARLKQGLDFENEPLIIAKGRLDELSQNPSYLEREYDPIAFAASPDRDELIRATGGMMQSLHEAPLDLRNGRFKHDYLMLFPERLNYTLPEDLAVNLAEPGTYRMLTERAAKKYYEEVSADKQACESVVKSTIVQDKLSKGTVVNSYLVHFDAFDKPGEHNKAKGRVRFSNRILGVILSGKDLNHSDALLGNSETIYESSHGRRTENDLVRISSDQHQVFLNFEVLGFIDQVRIVVEADSNELEIARFLDGSE